MSGEQRGPHEAREAEGLSSEGLAVEAKRVEKPSAADVKNETPPKPTFELRRGPSDEASFYLTVTFSTLLFEWA